MPADVNEFRLLFHTLTELHVRLGFFPDVCYNQTVRWSREKKRHLSTLMMLIRNEFASGLSK